MQRCECDEVPSLQRKHRGPGVSLAGCVGGDPLSKSFSLSFGKVKRDTGFLKVRVMSNTAFIPLEEKHHETTKTLELQREAPYLTPTFFDHIVQKVLKIFK